jgi:hypothetical protein
MLRSLRPATSRLLPHDSECAMKRSVELWAAEIYPVTARFVDAPERIRTSDLRFRRRGLGGFLVRWRRF